MINGWKIGEQVILLANNGWQTARPHVSCSSFNGFKSAIRWA